MQRVTHEMLQSYVGGQMEIQNEVEGYLFRGEIRAIALTSKEFYVRFRWLAKRGGKIVPPPLYGADWIAQENLDQVLGPDCCMFDILERGPDDSLPRIMIRSSAAMETCVLFGADYERNLEKSSVLAASTPKAKARRRR